MTPVRFLSVVAVVDENVPMAEENLAAAVSALNSPRGGVLNGHTLKLTTVVSRDNDTFCNSDQGQ